MKYFILLLATILLLVGCQKSEGIGGKLSIKGVIQVLNIEEGEIRAKYPAQNHQVYIIYGDGELYDDDFKTSFNGAFEFNYLNKGSYQVFTYGECMTCPQGQDSLIRIPIELSTKENFTMDTITVFKFI